MRSTIWIAFLATALMFGCTKKREDRFSQGQGLRLQTKSAMDGQTHTLTTGKIWSKAATTAAKNRVIEAENGEMPKNINHFDYVTWTSDSELLNIGSEIPIRGPEGDQFEIRYQTTDTLLKVLKVGPREKIPFEEWTYAEQLENDLIGVPLVGFKISWFTVEKTRNQDNEETNEYVERAQPNKASGTHYRVDKNSRQVFESVAKKDVYPLEYFTEGEWFFSEFWHATGHAKVWPGDSCRPGGFMAPTMHIKFHSSPSGLLGKTTNIAKEDDFGNDISVRNILFLPTEAIDTRVADAGAGTGLKEVEDDRIDDRNKKFIKAKFASIGTPCTGVPQPEANDILDLRISKNYFSYTVNDEARGVKVTYAFWRRSADEPHQKYETKNFHEKDYKHFGMIFTPGAVVENSIHHYTREDIRKNLRIARFNPKKNVVWYISSESPKELWVRDVTKKAVDYWNSAFRAAGTSMSIVFVDPLGNNCQAEKDNAEKLKACIDKHWDMSKTRGAGDLRYNTVNFIGERLNGLLGFGPMRADPVTGETISAHSQIYYSSFESSLYSRLMAYMFIKLGAYSEGGANEISPTNVLNPMSATPTGVEGWGRVKQWNAPEISEFFKKSGVSENLVHRDFVTPLSAQWGETSNSVTLTQKKSEEPTAEVIDSQIERLFPAARALFKQGPHHGASLINSFRSIARQVERTPECAALMNVKSNHSADTMTTETERGIIKPCMWALMGSFMTPTVTHELGHNFGLFHNFSATTDKENFFTKAQIKDIYDLDVAEDEIPQSTSIMDYQNDSRNTELEFPGLYDIAAIRYMYAGCDNGDTTCGKIMRKTPANGQQYLEIPNGVSIDEAISATEEFQAARSEAKITKSDAAVAADLFVNFRYCQNPGLDVFCKRHDAGTSSNEIVSNYISDYKTSLAMGAKRLKNHRLSLNQADRRLGIYIIPMRRHYDHWRHRLHQILVGKVKDSKYLSGLDRGIYGQLLEAIKNGQFKELERYEGEFEDLLEMRETFFNFLVEITMLSNEYCMVKTTDESGSSYLNALELEMVREQLKHTGAKVGSCTDSVVVEYFKSQKGEIVGQVGRPMFNRRDSLDDRDAHDFDYEYDTHGVALDRYYAAMAMGARLGLLQHSREIGLYPNLLDEPDLRERFYRALKKRLFYGQEINLVPFAGRRAGVATFKRFHYEANILPDLARIYVQGLPVPFDLTESLRRLEPFQSIASRNRFWIQETPASTEEAGVAFATQSLRANEARDIVVKHRRIGDMSMNSNLPEPIDERLVSWLYSQFILPGLPFDEKEMSFQQIHSLGSTLTAILQGDTLPNIVRGSAAQLGIDMSNEEEANAQIAAKVQTTRWFFNNLFTWDLLIFNNALQITIDGARLNLPEAMNKLTNDAALAEQVRAKWREVIEDNATNFDKMSPILAELVAARNAADEKQARINGIQQQIDQTEAAIAELSQLIGLLEQDFIDRQEQFNCTENSEDENCADRNRDTINSFKATVAINREAVEEYKKQLEDVRNELKPDQEKIAELKAKLEAEGITPDVMRILAEAHENYLAAEQDAALANRQRAQFANQLNGVLQTNFAGIYHDNKLPMKTQGNLSAARMTSIIQMYNEEAGWTRLNPREKEGAEKCFDWRTPLSIGWHLPVKYLRGMRRFRYAAVVSNSFSKTINGPGSQGHFLIGGIHIF